jgi:hypothetical protein
MGGKHNPLTHICNQMIIAPRIQLVCIVIGDDGTDHFVC